MNNIEKAFAKNKKVLIPSITAGDPDLEATKELILAMEEAGAGVIELGIPFSDPEFKKRIKEEVDRRLSEISFAPTKKPARKGDNT